MASPRTMVSTQGKAVRDDVSKHKLCSHENLSFHATRRLPGDLIIVHVGCLTMRSFELTHVTRLLFAAYR